MVSGHQKSRDSSFQQERSSEICVLKLSTDYDLDFWSSDKASLRISLAKSSATEIFCITTLTHISSFSSPDLGPLYSLLGWSVHPRASKMVTTGA